MTYYKTVLRDQRTGHEVTTFSVVPHNPALYDGQTLTLVSTGECSVSDYINGRVAEVVNTMKGWSLIQDSLCMKWSTTSIDPDEFAEGMTEVTQAMWSCAKTLYKLFNKAQVHDVDIDNDMAHDLYNHYWSRDPKA